MKARFFVIFLVIFLICGPALTSCSRTGTCEMCGNKNVKLYKVQDDESILNLCSDCKKAYEINKENEKILSEQSDNTKGKKAYDWYSSLDQLETYIIDPESYIVRVQIILGYKKNDKKVSAEITSHRIELVDSLRNFFSKQTRETLKTSNEKNLRLEILKLINTSVLENQKILDVRFTKMEVIQK